ncbi:MAG: hypothetical protein L0H73_05305 [Nitrococcus sp.]|nr:hypothetical protein [Nitrococcus sp.]
MPKLPGFEFKAALKNDPDFKSRVQESARGHLAQLVKEAHGFVQDAVALVRQREGDPDVKVVLLIDSVERMRGAGSEAMKVYESVRNLFLNHGMNLSMPPLHVLYTIPPYLSILTAGVGGMMGAVPERLVSTHVFKRRSREPDPDGLRVLREVISRRYPEWPNLFQESALNQLALASGGDLRELFRLVRQCLPAVWNDQQLPLTPELVKAAEIAARRDAAHSGRPSWLAAAHRTHARNLSGIRCGPADLGALSRQPVGHELPQRRRLVRRASPGARRGGCL